MDDDPFESPKLLLARAKEHLRDAQGREKAFFDSNPYTTVIDNDPETGWDRHKLRFTRKVPGSLVATYADALSNLRHSLDHAMVASAIFVDKSANIKSIYFPFCEHASELTDTIKRKCRWVPERVKRFVAGRQPHKGVDRPILLYAMSKLAGTNKHQMLMPLYVESPGVIGIQSLDRLGRDTMPVGTWDAEKRNSRSFLFGQVPKRTTASTFDSG